MPDLPADLRQLLEHFERHLDLEHVERVRTRHRAALGGARLERPPLVCKVDYAGSDFRPYLVREILDDPRKMLVNELLIGFTSLYHVLDRRDDTPYCLRANLGTGVIASMFGAEVEVLEDNPPWTRPLGSAAALERASNADLPDVAAGLGRRMLDHYAFFDDVLQHYPKCAAAFEITLPDLQGPLDTAEMLWGSAIYLALRRKPEQVRALLDRIAAQMMRVYAAVAPYVRDRLAPVGQFQHATGVGGRLLLRNDSTVLISPRMYSAIVAEFDTRLVDRLDGAVHFCGDGSHQIDAFLAIPGLRGLDFGQSELMDTTAIYTKTRSRGIPVSRIRVTRDDLLGGSLPHRFPTLANFYYAAQDADDAQRVSARYFDSQHRDVASD